MQLRRLVQLQLHERELDLSEAFGWAFQQMSYEVDTSRVAPVGWFVRIVLVRIGSSWPVWTPNDWMEVGAGQDYWAIPKRKTDLN